MIHIRDEKTCLGGAPLLESFKNSGFSIGDGIDVKVNGPQSRKQKFKGVLVVGNDGQDCVDLHHRTGAPQLATLTELFKSYDGDYLEIVVGPWPSPRSPENEKVLQVEDPQRISF